MTRRKYVPTRLYRRTPKEMREVVAIIRRWHCRANIDEYEGDPRAVIHWERATVDPGGTIFGLGPYLKLCVEPPAEQGWGEKYRCGIRVYPNAYGRKKLRQLEAERAAGEAGER